MPLKLSVTLGHQVGGTGLGARSASVSLETELDPAAADDSARLQEKVRQLFGLARTALVEELSRGGLPNPQTSPPPNPPNSNNDGPRSVSLRRATEAQVKAIRGLAKQKGADLTALMYNRWRVRQAEKLNIRQASLLIDLLKNDQNPAG